MRPWLVPLIIDVLELCRIGLYARALNSISSLLNHPLDAIEQDSTLSSQLPLTVLASAPRFCHSLSELFSLFGLLSSFPLRSLVCFTAFLSLSLLSLGKAVFLCERDDFLTAAVVDA
jgi:hypothetical protein